MVAVIVAIVVEGKDILVVENQIKGRGKMA